MTPKRREAMHKRYLLVKGTFTGLTQPNIINRLRYSHVEGQGSEYSVSRRRRTIMQKLSTQSVAMLVVN